jgi:hypothetical protein
VDALARGDRLQVLAIGPHGGDLLAPIGLKEVERDATPIGAPVGEKTRLVAEDPDMSAVGVSAKKRIANPRTRMVVAEQDGPVLPRESRQRWRGHNRRSDQAQRSYRGWLSNSHRTTRTPDHPGPPHVSPSLTRRERAIAPSTARLLRPNVADEPKWSIGIPAMGPTTHFSR